MSILLTTAVISQLCYDPTMDIGDHFWLKKAQLLESPLTALVEHKKAGCIELSNNEKRKEAEFLVKVDASGKTLVIK